MSSWTHAICEACWEERQPGQVPYRIKRVPLETCCFCGKGTLSGIYTREDPAKCLCKGIHDGEPPTQDPVH